MPIARGHLGTLVLAALIGPLALCGNAGAADPVIAAAGDIACAHDDPDYNDGAGTSGHCQQRATSDLLAGAGLAAVLPLGDIQYDSASATDLNLVYDPTWGRVKSISRPVIGNHEGAGRDYYDYFNGKGAADGLAGPRDKGWYSFEVGSWHIVALNSNCSRVACTAGSEQEQWLRADLAAHPTACTLAYWHHPRYSSGHDGSNTFMQPLWKALDDAKAEIVLSGHSHNYERFAPLDVNGNLARDDGIRQFVVGTGGAFFTGGLDTLIPNSQVAQNKSFGVLFLTLHQSSYDWQFVPAGGGTFSDSGTALCRGAAPPPPPPPPPPPGPPAPPAGEPAATPAPDPIAGSPLDRTAPVISSLVLMPRHFEAGRRGNGATFRYMVSEKAVLRFRIFLRASGRYMPVAGFTQRAAAGRNSRRYRGMTGARRLEPGAYRAAIVATDSAGNDSRPVKVRFTIARRHRGR
jgi:acid phosphatase type 7